MSGTRQDDQDSAPRPQGPPPGLSVAGQGEGDDTGGVTVSPDVRARLVDLAAQVLGSWDSATVPVALRRVRKFAPRRRASAGAAPLWQSLETNGPFRHAVATAWCAAHPEEARDLVPDGEPLSPRPSAPSAGGAAPSKRPGGADGAGASGEVRAQASGAVEHGARAGDASAGTASPTELAVGAYLLRPDGWRDHLDRAARDAQDREERHHRAHDTDRAVAERDRARAELDELRRTVAVDQAALDEARAEITTLRRAERRLRSDADRARAEARAALAEADARTAAAEELLARATAERRDAAVALERAHAARDEARALTHTGAELANARARLLLETVVEAAVGLRRELGIPPTTLRPGDTVAPVDGSDTAQHTSTTRPGSRGRAGDDPALLDDVLAVPQMHLIVDGYNVSKTGFGTLTLAQQRRRLVDGLVRIASRTGAEVTCCFDGQDLGHLPPASTRGVRVLFSSGEIADHLIRRLVAAEPEGRPVAVVTSDREVADDVQAMGAVAIGSPALVARLARL
jgi:predicted RNA-binding protein with PIN domain